MSLKAIFQGRRYLVLSQTDDGVWLVSLDRSATPVHVGVDHRDLMLNPSESDARLAEAYEQGEITAFEYPDGHTYPPGRETGPIENGDDSDGVH